MRLKLSYCILLLLFCSCLAMGQKTFTITKLDKSQHTYESLPYGQPSGYDANVGGWSWQLGGYIAAASVERRTQYNQKIARGKHIMLLKPVTQQAKYKAALRYCRNLSTNGLGRNAQWSLLSRKDFIAQGYTLEIFTKIGETYHISAWLETEYPDRNMSINHYEPIRFTPGTMGNTNWNNPQFFWCGCKW